MGAEGAVNIIHRAELAEAEDPDSTHTELVEEYRRKLADLYVAARNGWLDDVVEPEQTRLKLIRALRPLKVSVSGSRRKARKYPACDYNLIQNLIEARNIVDISRCENSLPSL